MQDLFTYNPLTATYSSIYSSLTELREIFHRSGRLDDSNAKLDEIVKLIAMYLAYKRKLISNFPQVDKNAPEKLVSDLSKCFQETQRLDCFRNQDGSSIFGSNPSLCFQKGDEELAIASVSLVKDTIDVAIANRNLEEPFDVLNEAFGHFVRDNFRSNIEDAQYMTPPEVVDFMVSIALEDIESLSNSVPNNSPLLILDPTCGVGSFLTTFYHKSKKVPFIDNRKIRLIGQDKIDRMVRLTKVNLELFEAVDYQITIGNSLSKDSPLSELNGSIDLILTNPPFGAVFDNRQVQAFGNLNLPIFAPLSERLSRVSSELLFIDRNLSLLRDGGRLLIIVPDSVISSRGIPALLRQQLINKSYIRAIIELPTVTFAQAGTRTRTCILYLIKSPNPEYDQKTVFIARSRELGFDVTSRKGVQIKNSKGKNDLPEILNAYKSFTSSGRTAVTTIINEDPSSVEVAYNDFVNDSWTPNHYSAKRLKSISILKTHQGINPVSLLNYVLFHSSTRDRIKYTVDYYFLGIKHVIGEGLIDFDSIIKYRPKTPGIPVTPDEIIFSKINPRIPRVLVVPELSKPILCSSEFEVMSVKNNVDPYLIAYLMLAPSVQAQIQSLTSGTSASHNRVKTEDLANVLLPIPETGSDYEVELNHLVAEYREITNNLIYELVKLSDLSVKRGLF